MNKFCQNILDEGFVLKKKNIHFLVVRICDRVLLEEHEGGEEGMQGSRFCEENQRRVFL